MVIAVVVVALLLHSALVLRRIDGERAAAVLDLVDVPSSQGSIIKGSHVVAAAAADMWWVVTMVMKMATFLMIVIRVVVVMRGYRRGIIIWRELCC